MNQLQRRMFTISDNDGNYSPLGDYHMRKMWRQFETHMWEGCGKLLFDKLAKEELDV